MSIGIAGVVSPRMPMRTPSTSRMSELANAGCPVAASTTFAARNLNRASAMAESSTARPPSNSWFPTVIAS